MFEENRAKVIRVYTNKTRRTPVEENRAKVIRRLLYSGPVSASPVEFTNYK